MHTQPHPRQTSQFGFTSRNELRPEEVPSLKSQTRRFGHRERPKQSPFRSELRCVRQSRPPLQVE